MAEPMSDADKIRNKRLAKLQQSQALTQSEEATASQPAKEETEIVSQPSQNVVPLVTEPSPETTTSRPATSRIRITPNVTPQKREMNGTQRPSSRQNEVPRQSETHEQWEDRILRSIFRVTLDPSQTTDSNSHELYPLPDLRAELESDGQEIRLHTELLDQALMEAGSALTRLKPHEWLFASWKRVIRLSKSVKERTPKNKKWTVLSEARRLCFNYCMLSITTPDLFGESVYDGNKAFADHMLNDPEDEQGLCHDFLTEAMSRWDDDDSIGTAFVAAVGELSKRLAHITMEGDYRPYLASMRRLVLFKPIAHAITQAEMFCDKSVPPALLEANTTLGPYFALSPLQALVTSQYFAGPKTMDQGRIRNAQQALQMALRTHQTELHEIVMPMIKASPEARGRVLDWFGMVINANHKRTAMRIDKTTVSSDGFIINVNVCLDQLSEPFIDASFSKIDRPELDYFRRQPRVDIGDETKMNATQDESDKYFSQTLPGENNFISEVFFLTVAAHHYGMEATRKTWDNMDRDLKHMEKQIEQFEAERHKYVSNPAQLQLFENALKKYKDKYEHGLSYKYAVQGVLLDEIVQTRSMQFMRFVTVWLLRQISGGAFPQKKLSLPFPAQSDALKCLPEYFLDVISGNFGFILYNLPQIILPTQSDELIMLCIAFLQMSDFLKNPYLKGSLVTVLFRGTWQFRGPVGILVNQYNSMPFALEHLLHAMMKFFIEAEFMGGHTQFFDKFNVRFEIFQIIKSIWPNPIYREKLLKEAKVNLDFFVRFVNLLLNDVTFVLDESFTSFHAIHDLSEELRTSGSTITQEQRQEKEEALEAAKSKAKSYMSLTNETVGMLKRFTETLGDAFTTPEIVQRLADMLDYNLDAMVPPKSESLKVDNLQQYNFQPRALLSEIVDVYLNLMDKPNFILAVARDGRSYKPQNFAQAKRIMQTRKLKNEEEIVEWDKLVAKFAQAKEEDEAAEADLGEIPDEFLDPLMATLMEDPVILPTSKNIVDRSTIRSHLLSDPNDPFNRVPLKIEDIVTATELKERIEKFKEERLGDRRKGFVETVETEPATGETADVMDTSA